MVCGWFKILAWFAGHHGREGREPDPLCEMVLRKFSNSGECPGGWPDDWKQDGATLDRRESTVYRLRSQKWSGPICVKIVKGAERGLKDSASFYEALCHYYKRSDRTNGYTVPRPHGWVPELHAIIMEWVEGPTFSAILKRQLLDRKKRHESIRKAAGWLRWFHTQSELEQGNLKNGWQLKAVRKVFEENHGLEKSAMANDAAISRYIEVASRFSVVLRGIEMDTAILHGDFKATNLIISSSGVVGIDFLGRRRGTVSQDIFRFLSDLDFYRCTVGRSFALGSSSTANDFDVFLTAYGWRAGGIAWESRVYLYFLTVLSMLVHQRRKFRRSAEQMIRMAVVSRIAKQLAHELSREPLAAGVQPVRVFWPVRLRVPGLQFPVDWGLAIWESDMIWSFV